MKIFLSVCRGAWLPVLMLAAACQSYQAEPLDRDSHSDEWQARRPIDGVSGADSAARSEPYQISLATAEQTALAFNPRLRKARAEAGVAAATALEAGRLSDPELVLGLSRSLQGGSDPWGVSAGIGFSIPLSGRLGAAKEEASAALKVAMARAVEQEQAVLREVRAAWRSLGASRMKSAVVTELLPRYREAATAARVLRDGGRLSAAEASVLDLEVTALEQERVAHDAEAARMVRVLHGLMGLHESVPLVLDAALGELPVVEVPSAVAPDGHALVNIARAEHERAEAGLKLAIERQYPDLTLMPGLEWDQGEPKAGVGLTIPLPFINTAKREIAEARAVRDSAREAWRATVEEVGSARLLALAALVAANARLAASIDTVLPEVVRHVESVRALNAAGRGGPMLTLDALRRLRDARIGVVDATAECWAARDEIEFLERDVVGAEAKSDSKPETSDGEDE